MAGIKAKISHMLHKDKDTTGTASSHTTGGGLSGATAGYDATTSSGGERDVNTGMSDLHLHQGSTERTTGLTEAGDSSYADTTPAVTGSSYETTTGGANYDNTRTGDISQGVTRSYDNSTGEIIDSERFTKTEDHEVVIEKKAYELEHRPVQKKYVVETKYMGERAVPGKATELLGTETREVEERTVEMPRGDRTIIVENVDVPYVTAAVENVDVPYVTAAAAIGSHTTGHHTTGLSDREIGRETVGTTGTSDYGQQSTSNYTQGNTLGSNPQTDGTYTSDNRGTY